MSAAAITLPEQAILALGDLLEAVVEADRAASGALLADLVPGALGHVAEGLAAGILRLVLLLHAEARGLLGGRSVIAIFERMRADEGALEGREAWPELAAIFRAFAGAPSGGEEGRLFDPSAYPFLDGPVRDAAARRVLERLLVAGGERVAYAELPLEGIGGVHEALLGVDLAIATGPTIALEPDHVLVDAGALLARPPADRAAAIEDATGVKVGPRVRAALARALSPAQILAALERRRSPRTPAPVPAGALVLAPTPARRRSGSHYTPRALAEAVVGAALAPLVQDADPAAILELAICDPSMGSGAFLLEACRWLADRLLDAGFAAPAAADPREAARRAVASRCLHGVDRDPTAVDLARISLWLLTGGGAPLRGFLGPHLQCGDSLVGAAPQELAAFPFDPADPPAARRLFDAWTATWFSSDPPTPIELPGYLAAARDGDASHPAAARAAALARRERFFHWTLAYPAIFARAGFDAVVGNPPWVAYAGRAAQPIAPALFRFHLQRSAAFFGYRTLHGLFVERAAGLLRPGGRLGLILPTSVSDLGGYKPVRDAHDRLAEADAELPDFGARAFEGVFQPAMALLSTRRARPAPAAIPPTWRLARTDLDPVAERLLARLAALPTLPAALFGERGYQTMGDDVRRLRAIDRPEPPHTLPLREGRDLGPFQARPPRLHLDPRGIEDRLRPPAAWREVRLLLRQTARYPIAALADGVAFRNSILAGFATPEHPEALLVAYLNSSPVRWFHYARFRDARQGMPQVKIGHLRALPAPIAGAPVLAELEALGRDLGHNNRGIDASSSARLDALAARALDLTDAELALIRAWAADNPLPRSTVD